MKQTPSSSLYRGTNTYHYLVIELKGPFWSVCAYLWCSSFSFQGVLSVMRQRNVSVDVQTFGSLALGCERQEDGLQLLKDMEVRIMFL